VPNNSAHKKPDSQDISIKEDPEVAAHVDNACTTMEGFPTETFVFPPYSCQQDFSALMNNMLMMGYSFNHNQH
jgi:hypothetical protein